MGRVFNFIHVKQCALSSILFPLPLLVFTILPLTHESDINS